MNFLSNEKNKKYGYLADLLSVLENSTEYKGVAIGEDQYLITQRDNDKNKLLEIISDELKKDGITKIIINQQVLVVINEENEED